MYDHKYAEMYSQLMKKKAVENKCDEEMKIGRKVEADALANFKLLYGDVDLDEEDDSIADISGTNIVTSTPDDSVKGTNKDSSNGNHVKLQGASSVVGNVMNVEDLSLKVQVGKLSNIDVSKMDDFKILCNPTVYGSFM